METVAPYIRRHPVDQTRRRRGQSRTRSASARTGLDTITKAINRAVCGVIRYSTGQKAGRPAGTPLVIAERARSCTSGLVRGRVGDQTLIQRPLGRRMERVCSLNPCARPRTHRLGKGISRLAGRPETWKRPRKEPSARNDRRCLKAFTFRWKDRVSNVRPSVGGVCISTGCFKTLKRLVFQIFEIFLKFEILQKSVFSLHCRVKAKLTMSLIVKVKYLLLVTALQVHRERFENNQFSCNAKIEIPFYLYLLNVQGNLSTFTWRGLWKIPVSLIRCLNKIRCLQNGIHH